MSILERINSSNDIKKLPEEELEPLCQELRDYMISSISRTGGHLASNLGAVELTVALHRVYDTSRDRVVFDVGHQSYVHKIITGRRDSFCTLRQHGGQLPPAAYLLGGAEPEGVRHQLRRRVG